MILEESFFDNRNRLLVFISLNIRRVERILHLLSITSFHLLDDRFFPCLFAHITLIQDAFIASGAFLSARLTGSHAHKDTDFLICLNHNFENILVLTVSQTRFLKVHEEKEVWQQGEGQEDEVVSCLHSIVHDSQLAQGLEEITKANTCTESAH